MTNKMPSISLKIRSFENQILYFNGMYKLPIAPYPTCFNVISHMVTKENVALYTDRQLLVRRLEEFYNVLKEEASEVDDIITKAYDHEVDYIDILTDLADWLGDIQIYCASEMVRYGIPINKTLAIIMQSNFSKLGSDGQPIYSGGKVQKGSHYWKPEPQIKEMLLAEQAEFDSHNEPF